jgi:hypothetical protein
MKESWGREDELRTAADTKIVARLACKSNCFSANQGHPMPQPPEYPTSTVQLEASGQKQEGRRVVEKGWCGILPAANIGTLVCMSQSDVELLAPKDGR